MTLRPPRPSALLMVGAVVVLGACGSDRAGSPPAAADDGTTATLAPSGPVAAQRLPVRDDLVDPQVVALRSWRAVDDRTLELVVTAGPAACFGAQTEVVESDTQVRVRVRVGRLPEAADRECAAVAEESAVVAGLAAPLGGRRVELLD